MGAGGETQATDTDGGPRSALKIEEDLSTNKIISMEGRETLTGVPGRSPGCPPRPYHVQSLPIHFFTNPTKTSAKSTPKCVLRAMG
jgi:hypothetical protein